MIAYFETSAFLKLILDEEGADATRRVWDVASEAVTVRLTYVEARAATAAANRARRLDGRAFAAADRAIDRRFAELAIIEAGPILVSAAANLARQWGLRGYDAVHLAAAVLAGAGGEMVMATFDRRVARAARGEGLQTAGV